jgi:hypothetical protein
MLLLLVKIYYLIIVMGKIDRLEKTVSRNIASYGKKKNNTRRTGEWLIYLMLL